MTLRPSELLHVCHEIAHRLGGRPLQKVFQPDEHSLYLGFPQQWIVISVDARMGRVHLADERPPGTGEAAPAFCMLLRKLLTGARLTSVETVAGERAFTLEFKRSPHMAPLETDPSPAWNHQTGGRSSAPQGGELHRLVVLLYGAGARLLLVNQEGRALGAIGPGRATGHELPPPRVDDQPSRFPVEGTSAAIAAHYASAAFTSHDQQARTTAVAASRKMLERLRRRERALTGDLDRVAHAVDRRRHADLLLAHLAEVPRGATEIVLPDDFADGSPTTIALDPALGPKQNVSRMYRAYQRMARGRSAIETRLAETRLELQRAERLHEGLANGADPVPIIAPRPPQAGPAKRRSTARPPYREFRSSTGARILVGRGAEKNDALTFQVARGSDLWLHTRDVPGAHVIIALNGPAPVDQETLLDAATLAVHHSPARDEPQADVTYAYRKHLRKPRGAAPGLVTISSGKTLRIRIEADRLARLLASRIED